MNITNTQMKKWTIQKSPLSQEQIARMRASRGHKRPNGHLLEVPVEIAAGKEIGQIVLTSGGRGFSLKSRNDKTAILEGNVNRDRVTLARKNIAVKQLAALGKPITPGEWPSLKNLRKEIAMTKANE